ncbi:MAG: protein adenylyltransferase SelO [Gammaproteobacteria bacterium]
MAAWEFDNRFVRELPADADLENRSRQVHGACYTEVLPTPVAAPKTLAVAKEVADLLDLSEADWQSQEFAEVFAGNALLKDMQPYAACYGGHQFGHWSGQLGDGRAIVLGEILNQRNERWTLQLKGAGPTPYSRRADGRAVLRSSVREFLCSEAMHHLGIPTTRALSLVATGDEIWRDMLYDGNPAYEPGAVVCRVAPSFVRFGNFEIFAARDDRENLQHLTEYVLRTDFPEIVAEHGVGREAILAMLHEVARRTALLMVDWMRVGFVHGVMNTDNLSILGLTIDYGPYGWLEDFDPNWTPNTTDAEGRRYAYGQQPQIAQWNLTKLAQALHVLVDSVPDLQDAMKTYSDTFRSHWDQMMANKLGWGAYRGNDDQQMIQRLLQLLQRTESDWTRFFRRFAALDAQPSDEALAAFEAAIRYRPEQVGKVLQDEWRAWVAQALLRREDDPRSAAQRRAEADRINPKYVLRNYLAQQAIDLATEGDASEIERLLDLLRHPYDEQPERAHYDALRPEWARFKPGCSMLSCSS